MLALYAPGMPDPEPEGTDEAVSGEQPGDAVADEPAEPAPDGVRLLAAIPTGPVARGVALDHLRPWNVHAFGPIHDVPALAASGRRIFTHIRDRFDLSRVPMHDEATTAFVVDNPRTAIALHQMHGIEPDRVARLGFPAPPPVPDGASPTGTLLIVPNEGERTFRINDPGSAASYGVLHLDDPFAGHRLAAAVEAGVPLAVMPGEAAREDLGPDGALYVEAAQDDIGDALSTLRDDALVRDALADAARMWAWQRRTAARMAEQLAALHGEPPP